MTLRIRVRLANDSIEIRFAFNQALVEWAKNELLNSTFVPAAFATDLDGVSSGKVGAFWKIPATPAAAYTLLRTSPLPLAGDTVGVEALAAQHVEDVRLAGDHLVGEELEQPSIRNKDLWGHQLRGYHFLKRRNGLAMLAMGMGTGKTLTLEAYAENEGCRFVLVLCPPTVLGVWRREVAKHSPNATAIILDDKTPRVRPGLKMKTEIKVAAAKAAVELHERTNNPHPLYIVINYEGAREKGFQAFALSRFWDLVALDESHRAKAPSGVTSKFCEKLRLRAKRRVCLTGTPMAHSPADLFSQFRFIDQSIFGDSFFQFKKRFAIEGFFKEIVGFRRKDELQRLFHSAAIVIDESVLDLPPFTMTERAFALPAKSMAIYRELWREMIVAVQGGTCSVDNALAKMIRAAQITSGYLVFDDDADPFRTFARDEFEVLHDAKAELLKELLEDYQGGAPVVVFCRFRYDLDRVRAIVEAMGLSCGEISGRQKDLTPNAQLEDGFDVFAVQVQSGGVGVDFTKAYLAVLYSIDWSLGNFEQMLRRLVRPGQTRNVRFVKFVAEGTVDRMVYERLEQRKEVVSEILAMIERGDLESVFDQERAVAQ